MILKKMKKAAQLRCFLFQKVVVSDVSNLRKWKKNP